MTAGGDTSEVGAAASTPHRHPRSALRAVAVPQEHGGWGLSGEPVLLGLLVAPSVAGALLGAAALVAFLARTPLRVVLVDRRRSRRLQRTAVARRVAAGEVLALAALVGVAGLRSGRPWWVPLLAAAPLVAVQLWFDMRSRSRRLIPELCGAVGIASVAAAIALAGGARWTIASGLWGVLAARSVSAIPFARTEVRRLKGHSGGIRDVGLAQAAALAGVAAGWAAGAVPAAAAALVAAVAACSLWLVRCPPPPTRILGIAQLLVGLAVVGVTAAAIRF